MSSLRLLPLCLFLAGCAATLPAPEPRPLDLDQALSGCFDNLAQYARADAALKVPPSVEGDWLDLQHACFRRVEAPAVGSQVYYLEWRKGDTQGAVSRQRIWSFRPLGEHQWAMEFYAFVDGKPWEGRGEQAGAFAALQGSDLRGYGESCALRYTRTAKGGWLGEVSAEGCRIVAASGRGMGIDARVLLHAEGIDYQESGRLDDGRYAFRVPPSQPYQFRRLP